MRARILHEDVDEATWLSVARRSSQATFFHTPFWTRLAVRANPHWYDATCSFDLPSGTTGVIPLLETSASKRPFSTRRISTAFGCYGGPVASEPLTDVEVQLVLAALKRTCRGQVTIVESPLAPLSPEGASAAQRKDFTNILRLDGDLQTFYAGLSKSRRYEVRKGRSLGVLSRLAVQLDDYRTYFSLYEESQARWGEKSTSAYPWVLFENCQRLATEQPENVALWVAEHDGRIVSGALIFYWNRHAVYWHGAASERGLKVHASSVLLADAIENAFERGLEWFDFNPSGGHQGVADFKRQFGTEEKLIRVLSYESRLSAAMRRLHAGALRAARASGVRRAVQHVRQAHEATRC